MNKKFQKNSYFRSEFLDKRHNKENKQYILLKNLRKKALMRSNLLPNVQYLGVVNHKGVDRPDYFCSKEN